MSLLGWTLPGQQNLISLDFGIMYTLQGSLLLTESVTVSKDMERERQGGAQKDILSETSVLVWGTER